MADNVAVTAGTGTTIAADEVVDGTLGTVKVQYVKIMDGVIDSTTKISPATSTKQPALGTAGTPSTDVLTVQGATSMTPFVAQGTFLEVTGSGAALNADLVASFDASAYRSFSIALQGVFSATATMQGSNDNTNFFSINGASTASNTVGTAVTVLNATNTAWYGPINYRFIRVRLTVYASGTVTSVAEFYTTPFQPVAYSAASGNPPVVGNINSGSSDSGAPVKIGGIAVNASPVAVTNGQRVNGTFDLLGKQITMPYSNPENFVDGTTAAMTGTASTQVLAAAGAGIRNYVKTITVTNSHATTDTVIQLLDGAGVKDQVYAKASTASYTITYDPPLRGTANTAFNAQNVTTGSNTFIHASGYTAP